MTDSEPTSAELLEQIARIAADFDATIRDEPVSRPSAARDIRERLATYDFAAPRPAADVLDDVASMLRTWNVHVVHPRYFGLFNPTVLPEAVAAESLAAVVNPQMAVWSHSPAANEIERHALRALTSLVGFDVDATAAHFTTGGQESNLTAVVAALAHRFPESVDAGVRAVPGAPVLYVSEEGHHSLVKAAGVTGLGRAAARMVPVTDDLRLDVDALRRVIDEDREAGRAPFLVVGTAGTTGAGVVDPLPELADLCATERLWFHVDAAWGGGALMSPNARRVLDGIERADSVAWDAHKWLSVPFAAGMFFCRRREVLAAAFDVASGYMPERRDGCDDLHRVSLQWTRRSLGLKVFAALATRGLSGYASMIDGQIAMGDALRARLVAAGWRIVNATPLPVVCFTHPEIAAGRATVGKVVGRVVKSGRAWVSPVKLAGRPPVIRACVTSCLTTTDDLDALVAALNDALSAREDGPPTA
jgi:glutamate/tyrosine decarboxylase-like PLP-dependent enzyme